VRKEDVFLLQSYNSHFALGRPLRSNSEETFAFALLLNRLFALPSKCALPLPSTCPCICHRKVLPTKGLWHRSAIEWPMEGPLASKCPCLCQFEAADHPEQRTSQSSTKLEKTDIMPTWAATNSLLMSAPQVHLENRQKTQSSIVAPFVKETSNRFYSSLHGVVSGSGYISFCGRS
jgi:hypothetical protein